MEPAEFTTEVGRRLQLQLSEKDRFCPFCDAVLDTRGRHAVICSCAGDRVARHNGARNAVGHFANSAGLHPTLEQSDLLPPRPDDPSAPNLRRPADVYLPAWNSGAPAALDLAITSPQRQEALTFASTEVGAAAKMYEQTKRTHLNTEGLCAAQGIQFVPLVAETSGGWGPSAHKVFQQLARLKGSKTSQDHGKILTQLLEVLCVAIRSANARAVLRRSVAEDGGTGPVQSAADALAAAEAA